MNTSDTSGFLPVSKEDMKARGWDGYDFLYVTGDAYVDHPSFGHAIISRVLEAHGYRVAILPQPDWHSADDFKKLGRPRLGVLVTAGNIDSMVNHYTASGGTTTRIRPVMRRGTALTARRSFTATVCARRSVIYRYL